MTYVTETLRVLVLETLMTDVTERLRILVLETLMTYFTESLRVLVLETLMTYVAERLRVLLLETLMTYVTERHRVPVLETQFLTPGFECNRALNDDYAFRNATTCPDDTTAFLEQTCFSFVCRTSERKHVYAAQRRKNNKQKAREHRRFFPYGLVSDVTSEAEAAWQP